MSKASIIVDNESVEKLSLKINEIFKSLPTSYPVVLREDVNEVRYKKFGFKDEDNFEWDIIKAMYLGDKFPVIDDSRVFTAFYRLFEIIDLAVVEMGRFKEGRDSAISVDILQQVDELILAVEKHCPNISPVISWFNTQRLRIGPNDNQVILNHTMDIFIDFKTLLLRYIPDKSFLEFERSDLDLV